MQIVSTLRDSTVYERDEGVRKILLSQINSLKDCKFLLIKSNMIPKLCYCRIEDGDVKPIISRQRNLRFTNKILGDNSRVSRTITCRN